MEERRSKGTLLIGLVWAPATEGKQAAGFRLRVGVAAGHGKASEAGEQGMSSMQFEPGNGAATLHKTMDGRTECDSGA
jgi:hypothetical protein